MALTVLPSMIYMCAISKSLQLSFQGKRSGNASNWEIVIMIRTVLSYSVNRLMSFQEG